MALTQEAQSTETWASSGEECQSFERVVGGEGRNRPPPYYCLPLKPKALALSSPLSVKDLTAAIKCHFPMTEVNPTEHVQNASCWHFCWHGSPKSFAPISRASPKR